MVHSIATTVLVVPAVSSRCLCALCSARRIQIKHEKRGASGAASHHPSVVRVQMDVVGGDREQLGASSGFVGESLVTGAAVRTGSR